MVSFEKENLVIKVKNAYSSYEDLFELQKSLINLMMLSDYSNVTDASEMYQVLNLLENTLLTPEQMQGLKIND